MAARYPFVEGWLVSLSDDAVVEVRQTALEGLALLDCQSLMDVAARLADDPDPDITQAGDLLRGEAWVRWRL